MELVLMDDHAGYDAPNSNAVSIAVNIKKADFIIVICVFGVTLLSLAAMVMISAMNLQESRIYGDFYPYIDESYIIENVRFEFYEGGLSVYCGEKTDNTNLVPVISGKYKLDGIKFRMYDLKLNKLTARLATIGDTKYMDPYELFSMLLASRRIGIYDSAGSRIIFKARGMGANKGIDRIIRKKTV